MLKFKKPSQDTQEDSLSQLRESYNSVQESKEKEEVVEQAVEEWVYQEEPTRKVKLRVAQISTCGCGGATYIDVERPVPIDSPLQDGDEVSEFDDLDEIL